MAANAYIHTVVVSDTKWSPLADESLVLSAEAFVWTTMAVTAPLDIRVIGGETAQIPKDKSFRLEGIDLSQVEVKGDSLYRVTVIGYTR